MKVDDNILLFLKTKKIDDYIIERLDDRSKRRNLDIHRKNVYLVTSKNKRYILLHFSSNFKLIFQNYTKAREVLGKLVQGDKWLMDRKNLLILLPYFGKVFSQPNKTPVGKIVDFLTKTHQLIRNDVFETPRYIWGLFNIKNNSLRFNQLKSVIKILKNKGVRFKYGPGVEDPAFNNFTEGVEKAYLVDLDNFTEKVNLDYELGFLAADINLEFPGYKYSLTDFEQISEKKIDQIMFDIGYICRLATIILDFDAGEPVSETRVRKIHQEIEGLGGDLLKILE